MSQSREDIAALIGSRICHDLISPIGAISNGVELLGLTGGANLPEIGLISESVDNANARIRFFRLAFGSASGDEQLGEAEPRKILADLTQGTRLEIVWISGPSTPRPQVKLAFLVINCLESAMPRGGTITVNRNGDAWQCVAQTDRMRIIPELWEGMTKGAEAPPATASQVQFLLAPLLAAELERSLTIDIGERGATVWF